MSAPLLSSRPLAHSDRVPAIAVTSSVPDARPDTSGHYELVAAAIRLLREHSKQQPTLTELAQTLGTSESHLQRVFSAWAGISPKRFLQYLTHRHAVEALRSQASVFEASLDAGLSGPGRLHDLTVSCEAMTPGEIASGGKGLTLQWGWGPSPFGDAFVAWSERGICELSLHDGTTRHALDQLVKDWPRSAIERDDTAATDLLSNIFRRPLERGRLHLLLRGTNFQIKVWEALLRVAPGELVSYQQLATTAGVPGASRAVGSTMARNRIAYLIPCHRVIRQSGDFGSYRWGIERKLALHAWESGP